MVSHIFYSSVCLLINLFLFINPLDFIISINLASRSLTFSHASWHLLMKPEKNLHFSFLLFTTHEFPLGYFWSSLSYWHCLFNEILSLKPPIVLCACFHLDLWIWLLWNYCLLHSIPGPYHRQFLLLLFPLCIGCTFLLLGMPWKLFLKTGHTKEDSVANLDIPPP